MDWGCTITIAYILIWSSWLGGIYVRHKYCPNPRTATRREIYAKEREKFGRLAYLGWITDVMGTASELMLPAVLMWMAFK